MLTRQIRYDSWIPRIPPENPRCNRTLHFGRCLALSCALIAGCRVADPPLAPIDVAPKREGARPWTMREPFPADAVEMAAAAPTRFPPGPFCCDGCEFIDTIGLRCNACDPMADKDSCGRDKVHCDEGHPVSWSDSDRELTCHTPTRNSISP